MAFLLNERLDSEEREIQQNAQMMLHNAMKLDSKEEEIKEDELVEEEA